MKPAHLGLVASFTLSLVLGACGGGRGASSDAPAVDASVVVPVVDASVDAPMPPMPTITVNRTGAGAVTSAPAGIDCGASCQASFAAGTQVTLTATPGQGATFTGWTGACTGTGACVVTAAGAAVVGATFAGGCMDECAAGASDCLSATTQRTCGEFDGDPCREWSPPTACTGVEECTLGRCGAEHELSVLPLAEAAVGTVTSVPEGITCGLDGRQCQHTYADGAQVTLTATSDPEAVFAGWALVPLGDTNAMACVGSLAPCTVTMNQVTTIAATYCTPECPLGGVRCSGATNVIETCGEFDGDPAPSSARRPPAAPACCARRPGAAPASWSPPPRKATARWRSTASPARRLRAPRASSLAAAPASPRSPGRPPCSPTGPAPAPAAARAP